MAEHTKNRLCRIHPAQVPDFVPVFLAKNRCKSTMCRMCRTLAPLTHMCACMRDAATTTKKSASHGCIPRHIRHIRHIVDFIGKKEKKGGTVSGTKKTNPAQAQNPGASRSRTILCTPENAAQMQQVVKAWPELHQLVQELQAQEMFPGLRGLRITLTGDAEHCAKGLGALLPENASQGRK
jgi:hypothetical protein